MSTLPNFLMIGAAKTATTSLYAYLKQHPQIYMSAIKEPAFFGIGEASPHFAYPFTPVLHRVKSLTDYQALFQNTNNAKAIGEASTIYMDWPSSAQRIYHHIPEVKIIAILRQPVERAYSHFLMSLSGGTEPLSDFIAAWQDGPNRIKQRWDPDLLYQQRGYYYPQLKRYFELFPRQQIRIYLYEDVMNHPFEMLRNIFGFLEIDDTFRPNVTRHYNVTKPPRNLRLQAWLVQPNRLKQIFHRFVPKAIRQQIYAQMKQWNQTTSLKLAPELLCELTATYRQDILQTQALIDRDLTHWLHD